MVRHTQRPDGTTGARWEANFGEEDLIVSVVRFGLDPVTDVGAAVVVADVAEGFGEVVDFRVGGLVAFWAGQGETGCSKGGFDGGDVKSVWIDVGEGDGAGVLPC